MRGTIIISGGKKNVVGFPFRLYSKNSRFFIMNWLKECFESLFPSIDIRDQYIKLPDKTKST